MASAGIAGGYVMFLAGARPHAPLAIGVALIMAGCALFVLTRPTAH